MTAHLLFLNDVAGSEIVLILVFILIFFGSKSIPGIARTMGRTMRQIKDATAQVQDEIKKSTGDFKKDLNLKSLIQDTADDLKKPLDQFKDDLDNAVQYKPAKPTSFPEANSPEVESIEIEDDGLLKESLLKPEQTEKKVADSEVKPDKQNNSEIDSTTKNL